MRYLLTVCLLVSALLSFAVAAPPVIQSHPRLQLPPPESKRPPGKGPAYYVDAARGDDSAAGSKDEPRRTVAASLELLHPGDTLYLRGGIYYENVYIALAGTKDKPITIRSYPGEQAIIDGSFQEFNSNPEQAWEPYPQGSAGEYRSKRRYANLRNIHGRFGDSMVGLQVYYHIEDLRGEDKQRYVGPGIWYNRATGRVHVRLAHYQKEGLVRGRGETSLAYLPARLHRLESYQGETDPRKLPLIVAPFHSVPVTIDRAQYLHLEDIVIRGGAHDVVDIRHGEHLVMDNVTIYAGSYGLRARNTGPFKLINSGIYGSVPPWSTRGESSLRERPWVSKGRNLTRLNTHALILTAAGDEFSVYYFPYNHLWEISNCEFSDAHDGVYLGDVDGLKFDHNYLHNFQDDGIYLSSLRKLYYPQNGPRLFYQNVISGTLMAFAYGGDARLGTEAHVFRNIIDGAAAVSDHGGPPWDGMRWYHNTILAPTKQVFRIRVKPGQTWNVFNNLCLLVDSPLKQLPAQSGVQEGSEVDGNYAGAVKFIGPKQFQLPKGSPLIDAGVPISSGWPDPLRSEDKGKPDVGAMPLGAGPLKVGRFGRYSF